MDNMSELKRLIRDGRRKMLFAIAEVDPEVLTGYSDRMKDLMHSDFDAIVREVEDRRLKLEMYGDDPEEDNAEEDDLW